MAGQSDRELSLFSVEELEFTLRMRPLTLYTISKWVLSISSLPIRDVRFHKVEAYLEAFKSRTIAVKIKNLSAVEMNIVRPFIGRTLQACYKHDSPELIPDSERF